MNRNDFTAFLTCVALSSALLACGDDETTETAAQAQPVEQEVVATESETAPQGRSVAGAMLAYAEVEGKLARGYFSYPVDMIEPLPAILLIHDQYGLTESFKMVADQVAAQGYIAVAVDLFGGASGRLPADTREPRVRLLEKPELARDNLAQAIDFVENSFGSTGFGAIGWGFGGLWAMNVATTYPDKVTAVGTVQGQPIANAEYLDKFTMPLLALYGASDRSVPVAEVNAFRALLEETGARFEMRTFPQAGRGFMLEDSRAYNAGQAAEAWRLIAAFIDANVTSVIPEG